MIYIDYKFETSKTIKYVFYFMSFCHFFLPLLNYLVKTKNIYVPTTYNIPIQPHELYEALYQYQKY